MYPCWARLCRSFGIVAYSVRSLPIAAALICVYASPPCNCMIRQANFAGCMAIRGAVGESYAPKQVAELQTVLSDSRFQHLWPSCRPQQACVSSLPVACIAQDACFDGSFTQRVFLAISSNIGYNVLRCIGAVFPMALRQKCTGKNPRNTVASLQCGVLQWFE